MSMILTPLVLQQEDTNPHPDVLNRFYAVGFSVNNTAVDGGAATNGLASCTSTTPGVCVGSTTSGTTVSAATCSGNYYFYGAGKKAGGNGPVTGIPSSGFTMAITASTFNAGAIGKIDTTTSADDDIWQINNQKKLLHINAGY